MVPLSKPVKRMSLEIFPLVCCPLEARVGPPQTRKRLRSHSPSADSWFLSTRPHLLRSISNLLKLLRRPLWSSLFLGKASMWSPGGTGQNLWQWAWPWGPNHPGHTSKSPTVGQFAPWGVGKSCPSTLVQAKAVRPHITPPRLLPAVSGSKIFAKLSCIIEMHTSHLYDPTHQFHPNKFN